MIKKTKQPKIKNIPLTVTLGDMTIDLTMPVNYMYDPETGTIFSVLPKEKFFKIYFSVEGYKSKPKGWQYAKMKFHGRSMTCDDVIKTLARGHTLIGKFKRNIRRNDNFISTQYVIFDIDDSKIPMHEYISKMEILKPTFAYETFSNDAEKSKYRFRMIYFFDRPLSKREHAKIYRIIRATAGFYDSDNCAESVALMMHGTYGTNKECYVSYTVFKASHFLDDPYPYVQEILSIKENHDVQPLFVETIDIIRLYDYSRERFFFPKYRNTEKIQDVPDRPVKGSPEWFDMITRRNIKLWKKKLITYQKEKRAQYLLKHVHNPVLKKAIQPFVADPLNDARVHDEKFEKTALNEYSTKLPEVSINRILDIQTVINKLGYKAFDEKYRRDYSIITNTFVEYSINNGYGITPDNYRELFVTYKHNKNTGKTEIKKRVDGQKRRKGLYTDALYILDIKRNVTFEELVYNLVHRVRFYYDNSDWALTPNCIIRKALDALICVKEGRCKLKDQHKGGKVKVSKMWCFEHNLSCRTVAKIACKLERYKVIDTWYNPELTPRENKRFRISNGLSSPSLLTLIRFAKSRNYKTTGNYKKINSLLEWYNPRLSVKENLEYAKSKGISVSQRTLYNFCAEYNIPTKGMQRVSKRITEIFKLKIPKVKKSKKSKVKKLNILIIFDSDVFNPQIKLRNKFFDGSNPYLNNFGHPEWATDRVFWTYLDWQNHLNKVA